MGNKVICPGSFDPVTLGHIDIITRASKMFDSVVVGVLNNPSKNPSFTTEERIELLRAVTTELDNIEIVAFDGLLADYTREHGITAIVKGLRAVTDFEYEFQQALFNKKLNPALDTIFLTSNSDFMYLSSSGVKQVAAFGGDISSFVPECVHDKILDRLKNKK
ncbi:MAG: pantetheine-phosphate adenylyltransferase [Ruminococcus sp.]|nr:pantetheine-phosphate adenylyltransferase [Ruminococcus sp.]